MSWFFGDPHSNPELHPGSPAGGPGPGYFKRPGPLLDPPSCSAVPHPDSPAARHVEWRSELPRLVAAQRAKAVYEALAGARSYAPAAVRRATGQELEAVIDGIVPGLLMFVGVLAATTALGAAAGAAIGALFAGVGAVPGAAIGADVGLGAGAAILEYLGLAFLVGYIGASVLQAAKVAADAVESAWHSPEHREIESTVIAQASRQLADAVALVFRGVLQGVLAFLLAKGTAAAASRVPELVAKLRASKLGGGFAEWVEKNWVRLIEEPRLKDGPPSVQPPVSARDSGPAITPSQLRKALGAEHSATRERSVKERVQGGDAAEYGPLNPGPLAEDVANTFRSSTYTGRALSSDQTLYRAISENGNPTGNYWTSVKPQGPLQSVIDSALDQNWGNTATRIVTARVPAGTTVYEGAAAAQRGLVGGGNQIYIPKVDPSWIVH